MDLDKTQVIVKSFYENGENKTYTLYNLHKDLFLKTAILNLLKKVDKTKSHDILQTSQASLKEEKKVWQTTNVLDGGVSV